MNLPPLRAGGIAGFLAVALGAFGAHGLEGRLDAQQQEWWETAVLYHSVHALALVLLGALQRSGLEVGRACLSFVAGIALFSGSLYAMALGAPSKLGMVTPLGGVAFLLGWGLLSFARPRSVT